MNAEQTNQNIELNLELNLELKGKSKPKAKAKKHIASTVNYTFTEQEVSLTLLDPTAILDPTTILDPTILDPTILDPTAIQDPAIQDPTILDPTILDPTILDPTAILDPTIQDPTILDPTILDPTILDPTIHDWGNTLGYLKFAHYAIHSNDPNFLFNLLLKPLPIIHNFVLDIVHFGDQHTIINYLRTLALKQTQKSVADTIVDELVTLARTEPPVRGSEPKKSRAKKTVDEHIDGVIAKKSRAKKAVVSEPIVDGAVPVAEPVAKKSRDNKTIVTVDDAVEIDAKPAKKTNAKPRTKKVAEKTAAEEITDEPTEELADV